MDFSNVKAITIPEGKVKKITNASGVVLWEIPNVVDTTPPTITAVVNGEFYNTNKQVYVRDENLASVTVNGTSQSFSGTEYYKEFTTDGVYTIIAKDSFDNTTTVKFTLDKTAPKINVKPTSVKNETGAYTSLSLQLVDLTSGNNYFTVDGVRYSRAGQYVDINDGSIFKWTTGEHIIVAYDKAGNSATATFLVDKG